MPTPHHTFPNLRIFDHPLIQQKLTRARDMRTAPGEFRRLVNEIAALMTFEISRSLPVAAVKVRTPLEQTEGAQISVPVTLVPILRAGMVMTEGILTLMPEARVAHVGIYRDEMTRKPVPYYAKFPANVGDGPALVVDPMLATGGTACDAAAKLKDLGCRDVNMICLVCAPEGVQRMLEEHPEVTIYAASLDRQLNDQGYILPGLGDAGDRLFGTL